MSINIPRPEYPRPDFERAEWLNLNGEWEFEFDDTEVGETGKWYINKQFTRKILVPFCFQSRMSGIGDTGMHEVLWYKREFSLPESFCGKRILLNFGAVDYLAKVWVNGEMAGCHKGGNTPFKFDITDLLKTGSNAVVVKAEDRYDTMQPRGKQYWKEKPDRCWYMPTSGIWQTVWLETAGETYIDKIRLTPDIDKSCIYGEVYLDRVLADAGLDVHISYKNNPVKKLNFNIDKKVTRFTINICEADEIDEMHYWTPERPNLYDIEFTLTCKGALADKVRSYFGMRKISIEGDMVFLNNKPLYQKLILDQGYWPESLLTPPDDAAIKYDIEMTRKMGFNGARKHQKIEDPRYYYWADRLGLLVWGEMPSGYRFNTLEIENLVQEMTEFINRDYNHPCIVTWVPLNESWGVRNILEDRNQQDLGRTLYHLIKAMDGTRPVSTNDGWEQIGSDICGIHDYVASGEDFTRIYLDLSRVIGGDTGRPKRMPYARGTKYEGQPFLITEYGGIAFEDKNGENWGYGGGVKDEESFLKRYSGITGAIRATPYIRGYCYTQLTDVMQEVNGLLTADRKLKVSLEEIRKING